MDELWTLQRSSADRKVAGVCAALAARYGIDPLLVRIVAVLLALSAGIGLALYAAAWALLPTDTDPVPPIHRMAPGLASVSRPVWTALVVIWTIGVAVVLGKGLTIGFGPILIVAVLWWFGVLRPRREVGSPRRPEPLAPPTTERDFVHEAFIWRARVEEHVRGVSWQAPVTPRRIAEPVHRPVYQPLPRPETWQAPWTLPGATAVAADPAVLAAVKRRRLVGWASLLGISLAWLLMASVAVTSVVPYTAVALLIVGLALVAATWLGRPRGLLAAAVVLLLVTVVSLGPRQVVASLHFAPDDTAALPATISSSVGDVFIDLSDAKVTSDRTVSVNLAAGEVIVIVPPETNLVVETKLGPGSFNAPGTFEEGPGRFSYVQRPDPTKPTLTLSVDLALGGLEVANP